MATLLHGHVDPLTTTWQLAPLFPPCVPRQRPRLPHDFKTPSVEPQKVKMAVVQSKNMERRARRRGAPARPRAEPTRTQAKMNPASTPVRIPVACELPANRDAHLEPRGCRVEPAKLLSEKGVKDLSEKDIKDLEKRNLQKHVLTLEVPVDYRNPEFGGLQTLHAEIIRPMEKASATENGTKLSSFSHLPTFAYLCGGPGSAHQESRHKDFTDWVVANGFQLLLLDYRGTGGSGVLDLDALKVLQGKNNSSDIEAFQNVRQGNLVRDLEAVRLYLAGERLKQKQPANGGSGAARNGQATRDHCSPPDEVYSSAQKTVDSSAPKKDDSLVPDEVDRLVVLGQSYGGWVAVKYVQDYPRSVRAALLSGAMPPIGASPDEVYRHLFDGVAKENRNFYNKHGETARPIVRRIAEAIIAHRQGPKRTCTSDVDEMPKNNLSLTTFASIGRVLGGQTGAADLLKQLQAIDRKLTEAEKAKMPFDLPELIFKDLDKHTFNARIMYGIEHETQCYVSSLGDSSIWAAKKVRDEGAHSDRYKWLSARKVTDLGPADGPDLWFLGEAFMPEHAEDYKDLRALGGTAFAERVARAGQTEEMWNWARLRDNLVPIFSVIYPSDMYVNPDLAESAARHVGAVTLERAAHLRHGAIRDKTNDLMQVFRSMGCPFFERPPAGRKG